MVRWSFLYDVGGNGITVPILDHGDRHPRDRAAESALLGSLEALDVLPGLRVVVGTERRLVPEQRLGGLDTATFVGEVLPVLRQRDDIVVTTEGRPRAYSEARRAADPGVDVRPGATAPPPTGSTSASRSRWPARTCRWRRSSRRSRAGTSTSSSTAAPGSRLDRPELETLRALVDEARSLQDKPTDPLRISVVHAGLWEELAALGRRRAAVRAVGRAVGALLDLDAVEPAELPAGLDATLRPYQVDGFRWLSLLWDCGLGGVLADDMGLGKTLQMLAMVLRAHERGELGDPVLVVAPTSVLSTWESEAARFAPSLRTVVVDRTRNKAGARARGDHRRRAGRHHLVRRGAHRRGGLPVAAVGLRSCSTRRSS